MYNPRAFSFREIEGAVAGRGGNGSPGQSRATSSILAATATQQLATNSTPGRASGARCRRQQRRRANASMVAAAVQEQPDVGLEVSRLPIRIRRSALTSPISVGIRMEGEFVVFFDAARPMQPVRVIPIVSPLSHPTNLPIIINDSFAKQLAMNYLQQSDDDEVAEEWQTTPLMSSRAKRESQPLPDLIIS